MNTSYEQMENDRKESSLNVYGLRSHLGDGLCQHCGSTDGKIQVWDNPELVMEGDWSKEDVKDTFTLEDCSVCNPQKGE